MSQNKKFEIAVDFSKFISLLENSEIDTKRPNARKLFGAWISLFEAPIIKKEKSENGLDIQIQSNLARFYPGRKRSDASYFRGNASCKYPGCQATYCLSVTEKTSGEKLTFVLVNVIQGGNHDHGLQKKQQLRGENRVNTVNQIRLNFNGSADAYVNHLAANGLENLPNKDVIRKAVSEVVNEEMVSTCWITNLFYAAGAQKSLIRSTRKKNGVHGYVQQFEAYPDFSLSLHTEVQLEALKKIPFDRRILHVDATGVKDSLNLDKEYSLLVNETTTSRHDSYQIGSMFRLLSNNFARISYGKASQFRLLMCDLSYATINACLEVICNGKNIGEYSRRVFKLSRNEIDPVKNTFLWIGSCNSHTMHRFVRLLRRSVKFLSSEHLDFAIRCFALLSGQFLEAWDILNFYLEKRLRLSEKSEKIIFNSKITGNNNNESSHDDDEETFDESIYSEKIEISQISKKQTIKAMSPFTSHFESFINVLVNSLIDSNEQINEIYNGEFIGFLSKNFLPYAFIWSGFVYRVVNTRNNKEISRLINGTIEKFFGTRKNFIKSPELPASYVNKTVTIALGQAKIFDSNICTENITCSESELETSYNKSDKNEINYNSLIFFLLKFIKKIFYNDSIILADPIIATDKWGKKIRKTKKKNFSSYNDPKPSKLKLNQPISSNSSVYTIVQLDRIDEITLNLDSNEDLETKKRKKETNDLLVLNKRLKNETIPESVKIGSSIFKSENFDELVHNKRLSDMTIEAFFRSIINNKTGFYLSSTLTTDICFRGMTSVSTLRKKLSKFEYLSGPVFRNSHWTLVFFSINDLTILYLDLFGATESEQKLNYENWLKCASSRNEFKNIT
ncbi:unnamed protein product [Brachionus calyciflorus]|uniref:Uncharacterized protein n=1 Tax=Brachionus calyciflorus TaxID=104777 RepID=A0A814KD52_9BILA|nr:unnamed protein product [Brachionus calyciflorus]